MRTLLITGGLLALTGLAAHAQSTNAPSAAEALNKQLKQAPPELDQKLRDRVSAFYQLLIDDKARKAEDLVLEEDREVFYKGDKPRYESYKIENINWNGDFTSATVLTALGYIMNDPRLGGRLNVVLPASSVWRLRDGQWFVEYRNYAVRESPFGPGGMHPGPFPGDKPSGDRTLQVSRQGINPEDLQRAIKFSKRDLMLDPTKASEDEIVISNGSPGVVELDFTVTKVGNVVFNLDRKSLQPGESAHLTAKYAPGEQEQRGKITFMMGISPFGMSYALSANFAGTAPDPTRPALRPVP